MSTVVLLPGGQYGHPPGSQIWPHRGTGSVPGLPVESGPHECEEWTECTARGILVRTDSVRTGATARRENHLKTIYFTVKAVFLDIFFAKRFFQTINWKNFKANNFYYKKNSPLGKRFLSSFRVGAWKPSQQCPPRSGCGQWEWTRVWTHPSPSGIPVWPWISG